VTFVGAFGSEYVAACAVGTSNETSSDVARARLPKLKNLRDERVLFMALSKQDGFSIAPLNGYDMVSRR
jgi:hypothetical protein